MRRTATFLAVVGLATFGSAAPVAADPARPTDYRSTVDAVVPSVDGVEVSVFGGDAFLELAAAPGHEVTVSGYQNEPYLRFLPDGVVERNRRSPATTLNETRFGNNEPAAGSDPEANPEWEEVATAGEYAWHDHRIHWMALDDPAVAPGEVVLRWTVPLVVDGRSVEVEGTLVREAPVSPWPWAAVALGVAGVLVAFGWRRRGWAAIGPAAVVVLACSVVATALGGAEWAVVPDGTGPSPLVVALPVAGTAAATVSVVNVLRRRRVEVAALAAAVAVAMVGGWALARLAVLWKPVLPTPLPEDLERAGVAIVLGGVASVAVALVRSGTLRSPGAVTRRPAGGGAAGQAAG
ncbi:MAG: hypothetical protein ACRD0A_11960 [Acidimicrobiales bacterium]